MKHLVNLLDLKSHAFESFHEGKYASSSAPLSDSWMTQNLGFHLEILPAGAFSCPYHFHHHEEELFYVLKGMAMVRQENEFFEVKAGDLIYFKTGVAHQFYNHSKDDFVFFALSNKIPYEVCEYPDSHKKWLRKEKKLLQDGVECDDYWKDERHPENFWPKNLL